MTRTKVCLSWSSGKDSAFALHELQQSAQYEVCALLTTVTAVHDRVSMHGVRRTLLRAQAEACGLDLVEVEIPAPCPNEIYEARMSAALESLQAHGIEAIAFGDLFLDDVRAYRERMLEPTPFAPIFPLWGRPTGVLAQEMMGSGIEAVLTCVNPRQIPATLCGRAWDGALVRELPVGADPCGENGEFHTFVHRSPTFNQPIPIEVGEVVEREGFVFADVVPRGGE